MFCFISQSDISCREELLTDRFRLLVLQLQVINSKVVLKRRIKRRVGGRKKKVHVCFFNCTVLSFIEESASEEQYTFLLYNMHYEFQISSHLVVSSMEGP